MQFLKEMDAYFVLTHPLGYASESLMPERIVAPWYDLLCASEKQRAHAFRSDTLRRDFIIAHGLLRMFLAWTMLEPDPSKLQFVVSARGKPMLDPSVHHQAPEFSLSHSRAHLAIAVGAAKSSVGVDVESLPLETYVELADTVLAGPEYLIWEAAPADEKATVFLRYWTRKEAYLKFTGQGLVDDLHEIDTSQKIVRVNGLGSGCRVCTLDLAPASLEWASRGVSGRLPSSVIALAGAVPPKALFNFYFQAGSFVRAPALVVC